jgi:hypothetical protein
MANNTSVGVYQANLLRAFKLTALGNVDAGADMLYSTDSVIEVVSTPNYETGQTIRRLHLGEAGRQLQLPRPHHEHLQVRRLHHELPRR